MLAVTGRADASEGVDIDSLASRAAMAWPGDAVHDTAPAESTLPDTVPLVLGPIPWPATAYRSFPPLPASRRLQG